MPYTPYQNPNFSKKRPHKTRNGNPGAMKVIIEENEALKAEISELEDVIQDQANQIAKYKSDAEKVVKKQAAKQRRDKKPQE